MPDPQDTTTRRKIRRVGVYVVAAIIGVAAAYFVGTAGDRPAHSPAAKSTPSLWHTYSVGQEGFKVDLPCQNTVSSPRPDTHGLLGSAQVATNAASCSYNKTVKSDTQGWTGCAFDIYTLPGDYPADRNGQLSWLHQNVRAHPVETTLAGAPALKTSGLLGSNAPTTNQTNYYVIDGQRLYYLQTICSDDSLDLLKHFTGSFTFIH